MSRTAPTTRKTPVSGWTAKLILAVIALLAIGGTLFHEQNPLTRSAEARATEIAVASAATYVTLRTMNAVLSSATEAEVTAGVFVAEGTVKPLRALEPLDDTIEKISSAVFAVMVATGVLSVGLGPLGAVGAALAAVGAVLLIALPARRLSGTLAVYGLLLWVGLPLTFVAAQEAATFLTDPTLARHQATIAEITAAVTLSDASPAEGWWERARETVEGMERYGDLARTIWNRADELIAAYVGLLSLYLVRLVVLPVAMLLGLVALVRRI
ncbi:hypothetical protein SAMN05421688_1398 [Poseidonocella pacifica]|uniref:Uncharacterized protein n=1 Tax=Poseidonocella pacifica TaxID=871651 RepID=A0A1I0WHQ5_9RHOB|nr:hypothetical protein [Poseidonocella pacifica]SFA87650.1 hypothetical protein SAMN05421688_1398 [Poseidonocella pacifica]